MHAHPDKNIRNVVDSWQGVLPLPRSGPSREGSAIRVVGHGSSLPAPWDGLQKERTSKLEDAQVPALLAQRRPQEISNGEPAGAEVANLRCR